MSIILDTNTLIDGRIEKLLATGIISEIVFIPEFILQELKAMADYPSETKKALARRGLEVAQRILNGRPLTLKIDLKPEGISFDTALLNSAKLLNAKLFTSDKNLILLAEANSVQCINIFDIYEAMRVELAVGTFIDVFVSKKGKQPRQALASLQDGTTICIEDAAHLIDHNATVEITNLIKTKNGYMSFAKVVEHHE